MIWVDTAIITVKTVILLLGSGITFTAFKAYRRTGSESLRALCLGFGVITVGTLFAGFVNQFLAVSLKVGLLIDSILVAIGFAIIMYSLFVSPD